MAHPDCPSRVTFTADTIEVLGLNAPETGQIVYTILSPTAVMFADKGDPGHSQTAVISNDHFTLHNCDMHRMP